MEAGGVCAAAATFGMAPAVIRCVSDLADPSKSDDEWRRRAMKTLAHLIENIDFGVLLRQ
jgi:nucleoside phosphorylase